MEIQSRPAHLRYRGAGRRRDVVVADMYPNATNAGLLATVGLGGFEATTWLGWVPPVPRPPPRGIRHYYGWPLLLPGAALAWRVFATAPRRAASARI